MFSVNFIVCCGSFVHQIISAFDDLFTALFKHSISTFERLCVAIVIFVTLFFLLDNLRNTSLKELYDKFVHAKRNRSAFFYTPLITHCLDTPKYIENTDFSHEAGFDAFMSGCIFITIAHIMAGIHYL